MQKVGAWTWEAEGHVGDERCQILKQNEGNKIPKDKIKKRKIERKKIRSLMAMNWDWVRSHTGMGKLAQATWQRNCFSSPTTTFKS